MTLLPALVIVVGQLAAVAAPPGGKGNDKDSDGTQDISLCVTVSDTADIVSDGGGDYCDSKKNKISAIVGRNQGQFYLETNTNLSSTGRSMVFFFPAGTQTQVFGDIGGVFAPTNVWIVSARARVGAGNGYVDLRTMEEGDLAAIAIRIQMELDGQNKVDLNYGDVLWAADEPESYPSIVPDAHLYLATVVGGPSTDEDNYSDSWSITGTTAWMSEVINNDSFGRIPIGPVPMSFSILATKK